MGTAPHYQGVILAAGEGSRMGPLGDHLPKALVPICNKPLLAYQLEHMRDLGIEEVLIVVGYLGHCIQAAFGDGADYGVRIRYVEQTERLGLAHAVGQLESQITGAFVLVLGDIYFDVPDWSAMIDTFEANRADAVLAVKTETDAEALKRNFSVTADAQGRVSQVEEKPKVVTTTVKGCGVYIFNQRIFDAVRGTPRSSLRNEFELTDAIQCLIDDAGVVYASHCVENDINITYVSDIIDANVYELNKRGLEFLHGDRVQLQDGCVLKHTVLGDDVQIPHAVSLEECVVMDGSILHATSVVRRAVVTPHALLT